MNENIRICQSCGKKTIPFNYLNGCPHCDWCFRYYKLYKKRGGNQMKSIRERYEDKLKEIKRKKISKEKEKIYEELIEFLNEELYEVYHYEEFEVYLMILEFRLGHLWNHNLIPWSPDKYSEFEKFILKKLKIGKKAERTPYGWGEPERVYPDSKIYYEKEFLNEFENEWR